MKPRSRTLRTKFRILKSNGFIKSRGIAWFKLNHPEIYKEAKKMKWL